LALLFSFPPLCLDSDIHTSTSHSLIHPSIHPFNAPDLAPFNPELAGRQHKPDSMAEILHQCVAASGTQISLISLKRTRLATIPTTFSHTLVLTRTSATAPRRPSSRIITNQQVLPSNSHYHPPSSTRDYLGALAQGLSSGHSSCQADSQGNLVFTTSSGSLLVTGIDPFDTTGTEVQWIPEPCQKNTTLSIVLDKDTTDNKLYFAQAQVAPLEYTHPTTTFGLSIHILGNHLDQQTWALVRIYRQYLYGVCYDATSPPNTPILHPPSSIVHRPPPFFYSL
jgi:hypothetical protein